MASNLLHPFMLPAFAAAGDTISNTATVTYEDEQGNDFESQSNTVQVTVAEIAGITVTPANVIDRNGGSFESNDILDFRFTVTNVGNDTTDVRLPGLGDIITQNFLLTGSNAQVEVFDSAGASIGSYTSNDPQLLVGDLGGDPLKAGDFVTVVVTGTVPNTGLNPGADISVTLGNTPPNDNSASTQNQTADTNDSNVATIDLADGADANEAPGTPAEEKEASATQSVDFATQQRPLALATVKKTDSNVAPGATGSANDDVITYDLTLTVENSSPTGAFVPAALDATPMRLNGDQESRILVADAIPAFTEFNGTVTPPNSDWTVVYSSSDPATTSAVVATGVTAAEWTTTAPTNPAERAAVRRIGFIYDPDVDGELLANGTEIAGFQFEVVASGLPAAGGDIYNLAQVFGSTYDELANPNDPVDQIIYDESGDDNPNNFNDNATPPTETSGGAADGSDYDPITNTGVADPLNHGTDDGTNTGVGPEGEDNQVTLTGEEQQGNDNILNGPDGNPDAVGATDDDDDYTNMGINPSTAGADTVVFTNTAANPTTNTSPIDNVTLQPIDPVTAAANDDDTANNPAKFGNAALIPNGTTVTLDYDPTPGNPAGAQQAIYSWDATNLEWDFVSSTGTLVANGPINVGTLQPGEEVDYTVTVDFPAGDPPAEGEVITVPIIAFPDTGNNGYTNETVNNITLDRIYVGFMDVTKEARILDENGNVVEDWTATPTVAAEPGYIIEYRITYENTSPALVGSGNVSLTAQNFRVIEDGDNVADSGAASGTNNWHSATAPLTIHVNGTSVSAGTVKYYTEFTDDGNDGNDTAIGAVDPADDANVEAYVNEVGTVAPGNGGTMIFRRQVQ
jgi:hypothetical protein